MTRVGTNFSLKNGNFFLENLFQILKKPFDVKRSYVKRSYASHVSDQKPIDYEQIVSDRI